MNESIINDNTTHDPEDYEAIHDHLADEDDIYNESYIISKKNYEINMDKWKPGTPLWITGSSGDGKSTYANQLAKEKKAFLVPLDLFLVRIAKPKEKYDKFLNDTSGTVISNGSQMVLDYINKHPEIPWADNVKGNWGTSGQDPELWNGLFNWLIDASAKNPKYKTKLIIFEGCNICLMPVEKAVKFPFIIMGTSRLQSSIRRIKRDKKEHDDYSIFKLVYRELKRSTKGVLPSLNKTKDNFEKGLKKQMKTINESSNVLMSNDEFFMEASKNPDIKARKRTVKNLRRIGVDRAHEVDNKKMIDKLERQIADLEKKWKNGEMSFSDYYDATEPLKKQIRKLEEGIDIEITDSYGKKHKTKLSSNNQTSDSYWEPHDIINITPETMKSNHFDSTFNHEAGHTEQAKRIGFNNLKQRDYTVSDKDDYIIKCAKLFLQKNVDKMNSHDDMWTELHADIISCKKSGYGKMIKDVYSFKKSKTELENAIDDCIKRDEEYRKKLENEHITVRDENGEKHIASQKDVDECIALYEEMQAKLDHSFEILDKRYEALEKQKFFGPLDMTKEYKTKLDKIYKKVKEKRDELYSEKNKLKRNFEHKGITAKDAKEYNKSMETHLKYYAKELEDLKKGFTTYDYRIKFMEDMKHIHDGHPERCSMKYPPMTPEDKKYMQEAECVLVSNEEFFEETYKPFDEYLKLNHYDPKTGTIDASNEYHYGQRKSKSDKRRPIGMPHSKKQWNRINKFLRENDYDPKTETIRTDVVDPKTGKKRRIKFNITDNFFNMKNHKTHAYFRYNDELENPEKDGERDLSINMQPRTMGVKPRYSNFSLKHEEGHYDDYLAQLFNTEHLNEIRAIKQMALDFDAEEDAAGNYDKLTNKDTHDRQSREHYADWYGAKHNPYDNSPNGVHLADGFNQTHDEWKRKVVSEKGGNKKDIGELIETLAKSGPANFENNVKDLNLSDKDKAKLRAAVVNYDRTKAEDRNLNSQKQLDKEKIHQQDDYKQMKSELRDIEKKLTESLKNKNSEDSEYFKNKYLELEKTFKDTFKPAEQSLEDEYSEKRKQLRDKLEEDIKAFSEELNNKTRKRLENASNKEKHKNAVAMANKRYAPHDQGLEGREKFVNYANEKLKENPNAKINEPVDDWLKFNVKTESSNVLVSNEEFFGLTE